MKKFPLVLSAVVKVSALTIACRQATTQRRFGATEVTVFFGATVLGVHSLGGAWGHDDAFREVCKNPEAWRLPCLPLDSTLVEIRLAGQLVAKGTLTGVHNPASALSAFHSEPQGFQPGPGYGLARTYQLVA